MSDKNLVTNETRQGLAENPFAAPVEGLQEAIDSGKPTLTKRFTILGGIAGIGYTVVLLIYGLRLQSVGRTDAVADARGPGLVEVVVQTLVIGAVSTVVMAIVGAGVGTFIEIVSSIVRGSESTRGGPNVSDQERPSK
jgi:hypothetical protein